MTASVPSNTALAASNTSARVGGVTDHRLHHLRRGDDHAIPLSGGRDQVFLNTNELRVAHFHPQIAAGNHDAVARVDDAIEQGGVCHNFSPFDLRDDGGLQTCSARSARA